MSKGVVLRQPVGPVQRLACGVRTPRAEVVQPLSQRTADLHAEGIVECTLAPAQTKRVDVDPHAERLLPRSNHDKLGGDGANRVRSEAMPFDVGVLPSHHHADRADTLGTYVDVAMIGYIVFLLASSAIGFWVGSTIYDAWQEPEDKVVTDRRNRVTTDSYAPPKRRAHKLPPPVMPELDPARPVPQISSVTAGNSDPGWDERSAGPKEPKDTAQEPPRQSVTAQEPPRQSVTAQEPPRQSVTATSDMPRIEVPVAKALATERAWFADEEPDTEELIAMGADDETELGDDETELLLAAEGPDEDDERTFHLDFSKAPHRTPAPSLIVEPKPQADPESPPAVDSALATRPGIQLDTLASPPPAPVVPSPDIDTLRAPPTPAQVELDEDSSDETLAALWNAEPDSEDLSSYVDPWQTAAPLLPGPQSPTGPQPPTGDGSADTVDDVLDLSHEDTVLVSPAIPPVLTAPITLPQPSSPPPSLQASADLAELRRTHARLLADHVQLDHEFQEMRRVYGELEGELETARQDEMSARERVRLLEASRVAADRDLSRRLDEARDEAEAAVRADASHVRQSQVIELQSKIASLQTTTQTLRMQLSSTARKLIAAETGLAEQLQATQSSDRDSEALRFEVQRLTGELEAASVLLGARAGDLDERDATLRAQATSQRDALDVLRERYDEAIDTHEATVTAQREALQQRERQLSASLAVRQELEAELTRLQGQIAQAAETEVAWAALEAETEGLRVELRARSEDDAAQAAVSADLEAELAAQEELADQRTQALEAEVGQLKSTVELLKVEEAERKAAAERRVAELEARLAGVTAQRAAGDDLTARRYAELQEELAALEASHAERQASKAAESARQRAEQEATHRALVAELHAVIERERRSRREAEERLAEDSRSHQTEAARVATLELRLTERDEALTQLQTSTAAQQQRLAENEALLQARDARLGETVATLEQRDEHLRELRASLERATTRTAELDAALTAREAALSQAQEGLRERDEELLEGEATLREREAQIHERSLEFRALEARVSDRDEALRRKNETLRTKDQELNTLLTELQHRADEVRAQDSAARANEDALRQARETLRQREAVLTERTSQLAARDEALRSRDLELSRIMQDHSLQTIELEHLQETVADLEAAMAEVEAARAAEADAARKAAEKARPGGSPIVPLRKSRYEVRRTHSLEPKPPPATRGRWSDRDD